MNCKACDEAELNPLTHSTSINPAHESNPMYEHHCKGCYARALANSLACQKALRGETSVELQNGILKFFGNGEGYQEGRKLVWEQIERIKKAKEERNGKARNS